VGIDGAHGETTAPPGVAGLLDEGLAAMRSGDPVRATACYADAASLAPRCAEALHARALIDWDAGDLAAAQAGLTRAAALAPDDAQIAENVQSMARARYERVLAGRATAHLATLPFLLGEAAPWPRLAGGAPVHIVAPFENPFGGSEAHALALARILSAEVQVSLWASQGPVPQELAARGVRAVDAEHGSHPQGGVLVLVGSWQAPPSWARAAAPERVIVVHNVDEPAALLDLVLALHDQTKRPIRLCMPSESFRVRSRLPGIAYSTPIDLMRFRPAEAPLRAPGPFTVGRHSRNDHRKFHPRDPAMFRRLGREGTRVRILGGTVLLRHFAPATPEAGVELLPTGTEEPSAFLRTLDAFVYRTCPMQVEVAGRVVAEAMATGIPVICSRETGFSELVTDGTDGYLFDADDDASLHARLAALRTDRSLRDAMGSAARAKAEARFGPALEMAIRAAFLGG
jgi:glycosyltransferase involved in cell wall biosynthesis